MAFTDWILASRWEVGAIIGSVKEAFLFVLDVKINLRIANLRQLIRFAEETVLSPTEPLPTRKCLSAPLQIAISSEACHRVRAVKDSVAGKTSAADVDSCLKAFRPIPKIVGGSFYIELAAIFGSKCLNVYTCTQFALAPTFAGPPTSGGPRTRGFGPERNT